MSPIAILLLLFTPSIRAYGSGAPCAVLENGGKPNHGPAGGALEPQSSESPYKLVVSREDGSPANSGPFGGGEKLTVQIWHTEEVRLLGFYLRAQSSEGGDDVGAFEKVPECARHVTWCEGGRFVTHRSAGQCVGPQAKPEITWKAPAEGIDGVTFTMTALKSHQQYWQTVLHLSGPGGAPIGAESKELSEQPELPRTQATDLDALATFAANAPRPAVKSGENFHRPQQPIQKQPIQRPLQPSVPSKTVFVPAGQDKEDEPTDGVHRIEQAAELRPKSVEDPNNALAGLLAGGFPKEESGPKSVVNPIFEEPPPAGTAECKGEPYDDGPECKKYIERDPQKNFCQIEGWTDYCGITCCREV